MATGRLASDQRRLLELPLTNAKTADEAASALREVFVREFSDNKQGTDVRTPKHRR
jgi:hypothetical protein